MPKFGMNENSQNFNLKNLFYRGNDKVENDKGYYGILLIFNKWKEKNLIFFDIL